MGGSSLPGAQEDGSPSDGRPGSLGAPGSVGVGTGGWSSGGSGGSDDPVGLGDVVTGGVVVGTGAADEGAEDATGTGVGEAAAVVPAPVPAPAPVPVPVPAPVPEFFGFRREGRGEYPTDTDSAPVTAGAVPSAPSPPGTPTAAGRLAGAAMFQPTATARGSPKATSPKNTDLGESRTF